MSEIIGCCLFFALIFGTFFAVSCVSRSEYKIIQRDEDQRDIDSLRFTMHKNGTCFAHWGFGMAGQVLTYVPCTPEVLESIKGE